MQENINAICILALNHINDKVLLSSLVDVVVVVIVIIIVVVVVIVVVVIVAVIVAVVLDDTAVLVITHFSCFRCFLNDRFQSRTNAITYSRFS